MKDLLVVLFFVAFLAGPALGKKCGRCYDKPFGRATKTSCEDRKTGYNSNYELCTCKRGSLVDCYRVRREFLSMPISERLRFIRAYVTMSTGSRFREKYQNLINIHSRQFGSRIHQEQEFLPWHRLFLLEVENLLRQVDSRVTMPYWDWSIFSGLPWKGGFRDLFSSSPWGFGANGSGRRGGCVVNGPFSNTKWKPSYKDQESRCPVTRYFNGNPPDIVAVHIVLQMSGNNFKGFELALRGTLHDGVHCRIGGQSRSTPRKRGTMCSKYSANAPEFFLHHGFIDKIWNDWQKVGDTKKDRHLRDAYFKGWRKNKMVSKNYRPHSLLDLTKQPGGVKVMYEDPKHKEYRQIRDYLNELTLKELEVIPRKKFTAVGTLEFGVFKMKSSERSRVKAEQKVLEPRHSLESKDLRTSTDRQMGVKVKDIEEAVKRKRSLELRKKQAREEHVAV